MDEEGKQSESWGKLDLPLAKLSPLLSDQPSGSSIHEGELTPQKERRGDERGWEGGSLAAPSSVALRSDATDAEQAEKEACESGRLGSGSSLESGESPAYVNLGIAGCLRLSSTRDRLTRTLAPECGQDRAAFTAAVLKHFNISEDAPYAKRLLSAMCNSHSKIYDKNNPLYHQSNNSRWRRGSKKKKPEKEDAAPGPKYIHPFRLLPDPQYIQRPDWATCAPYW